MNWEEVRVAYPDQWLVVEAVEAYTTSNHYRIPEKIAIVEQCVDGKAAFDSYRKYHAEYPSREYYFIHTSRVKFEVLERHWMGIQTRTV